MSFPQNSLIVKRDMITAPDSVFVAVYTIAKIAIAFILSRVFGAILYLLGNYDLYISTSKLSVASILNVRYTRNLIEKHRVATLIPFTTMLLILLADFYPTLMTSVTPTVEIVDVMTALNISAIVNTDWHFVPAYAGINGVKGRPGFTVDVPRTSNETLVWAGIPQLQTYSFLENDTYRQEFVPTDSRFIVGNFKRIPTREQRSEDMFGLVIQHGNLTIQASSLLADYNTTIDTVLQSSPTNVTAMVSYPLNGSLIMDFSNDVTSDLIISEGNLPRSFAVGSLAGGANEEGPNDLGWSHNFYSWAKIFYATNTTADHIIAKSGYTIDSFTDNGHDYVEDFKKKFSQLGKSTFESDQALSMLAKLDLRHDQRIFSATMASPGHCRLAILFYKTYNTTLIQRDGGNFRFIAQNITISTFPFDRTTKQEVRRNYGVTGSRVSPNINGLSHNAVVEYGTLAADYMAYEDPNSKHVMNLVRASSIVLSEDYNPQVALKCLDLLRTITNQCLGENCVMLAHVYPRKQFNLPVLLGIVIPIGLALVFFILTQRARKSLFFAELPDAIAATTDQQLIENAKSIAPNTQKIRLMRSGVSSNHYSMLVGDQVLKREEESGTVEGVKKTTNTKKAVL